MKTTEARDLIAEWLTARISEGFEHWVNESPTARAARRYQRPAQCHPAHDPTKAPRVPKALVDTRQVPPGNRTSVIFTWKVETDEPPYFIADVPTYWPRRIVAPGWAMVAGRPVIDVLEWDELRRPLRIKTVKLWSHFDPTIHGWRSWADNVEADVDWSSPDQPVLRAFERTAV